MVRLVFVEYLPVLASLLGPITAIPHEQTIARQNGWPAEIADKVHGPDWPDFVNKTTRWSTYEAPTFSEVFLPETEDDLSIGLQYLSSAQKPWLAKSGGHGYSPTLQVIQDAVLINMENFDFVIMNDNGTVLLGSGAKFSELTDVVGSAGRELTIGACPCVGAMGAMLGGGLGRFQGLHGLTSDALRRARVALWNGTVVEASDGVNEDLFWGLRGAGQNFGIVIEALFETYPASNEGIQYSSDMSFTADKLEDILNVTNYLQTPELDPALAIAIALAVDGTSLEPVILVNVVYPGTVEQGQAYANLYSPFSATFVEQMVPWTELSHVALPSVVEAGCVTGRRVNDYSVMTRDFSIQTFREAFDALAAFVQANPGASSSVIFIETFGQEALKSLPDNYSAFPHRQFFRNAVVLSTAYTDDSVAEAGDAWALEWRDKIARPEVSGYDQLHVYQNYAHDDEPLSALYGYDEWRHERLSGLKRSYDPHGYFDGYHPIPADLAGWS